MVLFLWTDAAVFEEDEMSCAKDGSLASNVSSSRTCACRERSVSSAFVFKLKSVVFRYFDPVSVI